MNGKIIILKAGIQLGLLTLKIESVIENAKRYYISDLAKEYCIKQLNKTTEHMAKFYST